MGAGPGAGFQCLHCPASFSTKSVLSVHMREAHGDKYPTKKFLASANKQQQMQQKAGQSQQQNASNGPLHAAPENAAPAVVKSVVICLQRVDEVPHQMVTDQS